MDCCNKPKDICLLFGSLPYIGSISLYDFYKFTNYDNLPGLEFLDFSIPRFYEAKGVKYFTNSKVRKEELKYFLTEKIREMDILPCYYDIAEKLNKLYNSYGNNGNVNIFAQYETQIFYFLFELFCTFDKPTKDNPLLKMIRLNNLIKKKNKKVFEIDDNNLIGVLEGDKRLVQHMQIERNSNITRLAKEIFILKHGKLFCEVCGIDSNEKYGKYSKNCIEGHHRIPLYKLKESKLITIEDIALVCPHCHEILHLNSELTVESLKQFLDDREYRLTL